MEPKRQVDGVYRPKPLTGKMTVTHLTKPNRKGRVHSKKVAIILVAALVAISLVAALYNKMTSHVSLVPPNIQKAVDFSVYYPDVKKLPAGYGLDTKSFQLAQPGVVLFAVTHNGSKSVIFSEEQQSSARDIVKFVSNYIPVNTTLQLILGQAKIGAYGSAPNLRTVASLPVQSGPWIIVTAPPEVRHDDLVKILHSLTD